MRRQMQKRVNYARLQQAKLQKQLTDSIKAREQAANKARDKVTADPHPQSRLRTGAHNRNTANKTN